MNKRGQFNLGVNKEETKIINKLRDKYAVNISGAFKIFLSQVLKNLEKNDPYIQN